MFVLFNPNAVVVVVDVVVVPICIIYLSVSFINLKIKYITFELEIEWMQWKTGKLPPFLAKKENQWVNQLNLSNLIESTTAKRKSFFFSFVEFFI